MCTNLDKFVTVNLPEFLLLVFEPNVVMKIDALERLHSVTVCYNAQTFYQNYELMPRPPGTVVSFDEFIAYCESKIPCQFTDILVDYRCAMNVSDLLRMDGWAQIYECVGQKCMKFLLFNCLLFVPLRGNAAYYCVHAPAQQSDRYEVVQSFREQAKKLWKLAAKKEEIGNGQKNCSEKKPIYFNIAGLLKNKPIYQTDADAMLREILMTDIGSGTTNRANSDDECFDGLKRKLKVMSGRDSAESRRVIYKNTIGDSFAGEVPLGRIKKFANTVVRKIVPRELFGFNGNRIQYCENLGRILNSGKLHNFTVEHIVHKIKAGKVNWLKATVADRRAELLTKFLVWLTNKFVFGRIVRYFWIATTNMPHNGIAYYVKSQWSTACHRKISPLTNGGEFFKQLPDENEATASSYRNWKVCPFAKPKGVRLVII